MYHHKRHFSLTLLVRRATLALVLAFCLPVFSLQAARVTVEFKEQQTTHQSNEIASNMLKVVNGSDKMLNFFLNLNLPAGWSSTKSKNNLYSLEAGDSLFIPVKLMFNGHEEGDVNNLITASLLSEKEKLQFATANWYMQVEKQSNWSASVDRRESFFINKTDTSSFELSVRNTGNSLEWFTVKVIPFAQLKAYYKYNMEEAPPFFNFHLKPGADTLIQFVVKSKPFQ